MTSSPEHANGSQLDNNDAHEIALVSYDARNLAYTAKSAEELFEQMPDDINSLSFEELGEIAEKLHELYTRCPEAFNYLSGSDRSGKITLSDMFGHLLNLKALGGLPASSDYRTIRVNVEKVEAKAELQEKVALALLNNLPTDDFTRDNNLSDLQTAQNLPEKVAKVMGLLESKDFFEEKARTLGAFYQADLRIYEEDGSVVNPKAQRAIDNLKDTLKYANSHNKGAEWLSHYNVIVDRVLNDEDSTIKTMVDVWEHLAKNIIEEHELNARNAQATFDSIISGEAAIYTSEQD